MALCLNATSGNSGDEQVVRSLMRLSRIAVAVAAAQAVVAIGISIFPNPEGWMGGILYCAAYAVPLALLGLALRSSRQSWRTLAGWLALALSVFYSIVVLGNWSGYSTQQAILAIGITAPTVVVDLAIFWTAALYSHGRGSPSAPVHS
jgi:hypothetical protein